MFSNIFILVCRHPRIKQESNCATVVMEEVMQKEVIKMKKTSATLKKVHVLRLRKKNSLKTLL